jgi:hypothetical protein
LSQFRPNPAIPEVLKRCGAASPDRTFAAAAKLSVRRTGGPRTLPTISQLQRHYAYSLDLLFVGDPDAYLKHSHCGHSYVMQHLRGSFTVASLTHRRTFQMLDLAAQTVTSCRQRSLQCWKLFAMANCCSDDPSRSVSAERNKAVPGALAQQVLDVSERRGKMNAHHHSQSDDLRASVKVLEGVCSRHEQRLRNRPTRLKPICSDKTAGNLKPRGQSLGCVPTRQNCLQSPDQA